VHRTVLRASAQYTGYGVDVRERDVWTALRADCLTVDLRVQAIDPDTAELGQSSTTNTWLIGNHSDELTAWIPVMAGRY
jgi:tRNASer (uridine44-2'-O)-methyltransferase